MKRLLTLDRRFEEAANAITAWVGLVLAMAGCLYLVQRTITATSGRLVLASSVIFGITLILVYLASFLYHATAEPQLKHYFRILDHCAIFLVIAGTYTPFALLNTQRGWGWDLFRAIWIIAIVGVGAKVFFFDKVGRHLSSAIYLAVGWIGLWFYTPIKESLASWQFSLVLYGALAYTIGVIFCSWRRIPYHHAIWHGFVLAGSFCHYIVILSSTLAGAI